MSTHRELIRILEDTIEWSLDAHFNFDDIYSEWSSLNGLLEQLNEHILDARKETADFDRLWLLYAPTAGLCEIVNSDSSVGNYMKLAARFDKWYKSARRA